MSKADCNNEERIAKLETAVAEVGTKIGEITSDIRIIRVKMEDTLEKVSEHDRALKGNNGNVGIISNVITSNSLITDLNQALRGTKEEPGLLADIREFKNFIAEYKDTQKWISRLIIGWIILTVLGGILVIAK